MTLKPLRILAVGRIRTPFWKDAVEHYRTRLVRWRRLVETCIRDADPALPPSERIAQESRNLLAALTPADIPICLDERGRSLSSRAFSQFLSELSEDVNRTPCFIIGGAFGYDDSVRQRAKRLLSFGSLTLPHELARVVLFEQLYRAEALSRNIPYHH